MLWTYYDFRRKDRLPGPHSRVCICHFRDGKKSNGPEICPRNEGKLFPVSESSSSKSSAAKKSKTMEKLPTIQQILDSMHNSEPASTSTPAHADPQPSTSEVILEAELDMTTKELQKHEEKNRYLREHYSVDSLSNEVLRMETGLPTREVFDIVVNYVSRFKDTMRYYSGWRVESISLQDQILITLMKLKQNYTNLHLAQLFSCSVATISNIALTFVHVLHATLFDDLMRTIPSREKNKNCLPSSFTQFSSCRIVIDCTDVEIAVPCLMSKQSATYSSYRGMNSFKVLVGVAPNGVITYVSDLFPGSVSDKFIVEKSGILRHFVTGDLVLADKGFLIQDIVPVGVSVNVPPFLNHGKLTESEAKATKDIARCRIHVERANARLKGFKVLSYIPSYLRCYADKLFQVCAALVNLQFPLIKEGCEDFEFE